MIRAKSNTIQIWCGLRAGYTEYVHDFREVGTFIIEYVATRKLAVSITKTDFYYPGGMEPGFVVGIINYPRFPRPETLLRYEACRLAGILMVRLDQYRVSITTPEHAYTLKNTKKQGYDE